MFIDEVINTGAVATVYVKDIPNGLSWDDLDDFLDNHYGRHDYIDYFSANGEMSFRFERYL